MTTYPTLSVAPTIEWGPGWATCDEEGRGALDAALTVHDIATDGATIATIEIVTSSGDGRLEVVAGIELTRRECIALAQRLLGVAVAARGPDENET